MYAININKWLESSIVNDNFKNTINAFNENEKADAFRKSLGFGTGGLRGLIGLGENRMNIYTVSRATKGLANYVKSVNASDGDISVAIAYDTRNMSKEFALQSALVFAQNGIKAYLFDDVRPTPQLSFAVRELKCSAGIVITASHNPKEYNGYKVYGPDGGQITLEFAQGVMKEIELVDLFESSIVQEEQIYLDSDMLIYIGSEVDEKYYTAIESLSMTPENKSVKVVYTPIHGTGLVPVREVLNRQGYSNVLILKSQENPDGNFSTVKSPNPEEAEALKLAIDYAKEMDADIVLGTDPDCDRVGVSIKTGDNQYELINGNQIGALLMHYIIETRDTFPSDGAVIKTIVTSDLGGIIAEFAGLKVINTLTGFKYIGEKIKEFEQTKHNSFVFGYEESYGYLSGTFVRDKDAVIASMLIVEMTSYYQGLNKTLQDVLEEIYEKHGYYMECLKSFTLKGIEGEKKINQLMSMFKDVDEVNQKFSANILFVEDYEKSLRKNVVTESEACIELPKANVMKYIFQDGSWLAIRPSGTEPKIKFYFSTNAKTKEESEVRMNNMKKEVEMIVSI